MSAMQHGTDDAVVDPGHQLEALVRMVQPHVSSLVFRPNPEKIIGLEGEPLEAICTPWIARFYRMTSRGLVIADRSFFVFTSTPRLLGHVSIALIEPKPRAVLIKELEELLDKHKRVFGVKKSA